jgi:hypothetical protein
MVYADTVSGGLKASGYHGWFGDRCLSLPEGFRLPDIGADVDHGSAILESIVKRVIRFTVLSFSLRRSL